jgi:hypothetical protein
MGSCKNLLYLTKDILKNIETLEECLLQENFVLNYIFHRLMFIKCIFVLCS